MFNRKSVGNTPSIVAHHAHVVVDHVRWIPQADAIHEQVLLPMFLPGAEMRAEDSRAFVREYCKYWSKASRFDLFESALDLLEDVWQ